MRTQIDQNAKALPAASHPKYYVRKPRKSKKDIQDKEINPDEYTPEAVLQRVNALTKESDSSEYSVDAVLERIKSRRSKL